jgi:hypothetical protein
MMNLIIEALKLFHENQRNSLRALKITMAPDVYLGVTDEQYDRYIGCRRFIDRELPEGHIRIIGTTRHGEVKMLSKVKF